LISTVRKPGLNLIRFSEPRTSYTYREWGSGPTRSVVFFLGGGFLELSSSSDAPSSEKVSLWLQVPDVDTLERGLGQADVDVVEPP